MSEGIPDVGIGTVTADEQVGLKSSGYRRQEGIKRIEPGVIPGERHHWNIERIAESGTFSDLLQVSRAGKEIAT
jgi:hypothetical protein